MLINFFIVQSCKPQLNLSEYNGTTFGILLWQYVRLGVACESNSAVLLKEPEEVSCSVIGLEVIKRTGKTFKVYIGVTYYNLIIVSSSPNLQGGGSYNILMSLYLSFPS